MLDLVWYCYILLVTESMGKCLLRSNETWLCCAPRAEGCNCNGGTLAVVLGAKGAPQILGLEWSDGLWCTVTLVACTTCAFQALRAASGRVKQDSDGSWMDSLLFCYMCSLLHRQKYVVALFCETKKEFCGTYEHFIKFFHSHPKQWSNVKHIHSICRMRIFYDWLVAGRGPDGGHAKIAGAPRGRNDGKCQPVSCEFPAPKEVTTFAPMACLAQEPEPPVTSRTQDAASQRHARGETFRSLPWQHIPTLLTLDSMCLYESWSGASSDRHVS